VSPGVEADAAAIGMELDERLVVVADLDLGQLS
jgi:hypothetical protein